MTRHRIQLAAIVIVLAPLAPLLLHPHATFNRDWENNQWMVAYARSYFAAHHHFPNTYDVLGRVGIPQPIFYGPLLYPCLAIVSEPVGVDGGIRLAVAAIWTLQFVLVYRLARCAAAGALESLAAAALVSWAVYPLTNLYNRGALAEFFATTLLTCGVAAGGLALIHPLGRRRIAFGLVSALCGALAVCSHGPTALVGGPLILLLAIAAFQIARTITRRRLLAVAGLALIGAAIVAPWVYVLGQMSSRLVIDVPNNPYYPMAGRWVRHSSIDSPWARLKPLPMNDSWSADMDAKSDTPYVDAQWNFPLVVLAVCSAVAAWPARRNRGLMLCCGLACLGLLIVSITPPLQDAFPQRLRGGIQFPYRLVTHVNVAALALLIAAWLARPPNLRGRTIAVLAMGLAAIALAIKLNHAMATINPAGTFAQQAESDYLQKLPATYNGQLDYTLSVPEKALPLVLSGVPVLTLNAPVGEGPLEDVQDVDGRLPYSAWIVTSIMNFPWNRLVLDGQAMPFDQTNNRAFHEAVLLSAGEHRIGYRFEPDEIWADLSMISWIALIATAAVMLMFFLRAS